MTSRVPPKGAGAGEEPNKPPGAGAKGFERIQKSGTIFQLCKDQTTDTDDVPGLPKGVEAVLPKPPPPPPNVLPPPPKPVFG